MKKIIVLKIGGSVITHKNRKGGYLRRKLFDDIAKNLKKLLDSNCSFHLVLIHGAGSVGHQLAHKYKLKDGAKKDPKKWRGSTVTRLQTQRMHTSLLETLTKCKLPVVYARTSSMVIHKNKKISWFGNDVFREMLRHDRIPLLYGEMVFDKDLGMSICSGDAIAAHLAQNYPVEKIFFASDVDGIFNKDPYKHKDAELIKRINLKKVFSKKVELSSSHSIDTTDGLQGKLKQFSDIQSKQLKKIIIFNGLEKKNYLEIFEKEEEDCRQTVIDVA